MVVDILAQFVVGAMGAALFARVICLASGEDKPRREYLKMMRSLSGGKRHPILYFFATKKRVMAALATVHPRRLEIIEHQTVLDGLKGVSGPKAEAERIRLEQAIEELYATPVRMAEIDGDAYMDALRPHLDELQAMRQAGDEAFLGTRAKKLTELNG